MSATHPLPTFAWHKASREELAAEVERLWRLGTTDTAKIADALCVREADVWNARCLNDRILDRARAE